MELVIHIVIALASVASTTYLFFVPSRTAFGLSRGLVALTLISGTYLVFSQPAHMLQACVSGLLYISFVLVMLAAARRKLANINVK